MTIELINPAPAELGFASPALGPWFSSDEALAAPDADLGAAVNFGAGEAWLPPTAGLLSLFVAESDRPYHIAGLRKPGGGPAFSDGRVVALFRLLPEAEERLDALLRFVPPAGAAPPAGDPTQAAAPTRARVRTFALELAASLDTSDPAALLDAVGELIVPGYPDYVGRGLTEEADIRRARAEYLGLSIPQGADEVVRSGARPMFDLKRPGRFELPPGPGITPEPEKLLRFPDGMSARLFVFDAHGLPLDPGAVAAWWAFLGNSVFENLWAAGFEGADLRTASLDGGARFTIHLLNPHGGHLPNNHPLLARAQVAGVDALGDDTAPRNLRSGAAGGVSVSFSPADPDADADDAPFPLAASLPGGRFAATAQLWPGDWATFALNRDFVQVALVETESHLVGVPRRLPEGEGNDVTRRRAADQNRVTTRVNVVRTTGEPIRTTTDAAAQSVLGVFDGADPATLVASAADRDYGFLAALAGLPAGRPPERLPELGAVPPAGSEELRDASGRRVGAVHPLIGGAGRVLVELALGAELAGAWVRVWAQDFSTTTGSRTRLDGGGARADAAGRALAVIKLEEGAVGTASPSGLDVLVKTEGGAREYPDLRFSRPAPVAGDPLAIGAAANVVVCETGQSLATASLSSAIPSGATVVALAGEGRSSPALLDRASIPAAAFLEATLVRRAASGDTLVLTQPAFVKQPGGDITASFDGVTVRRLVRSGADRITDGSAFAAGAPLPAQERLEVAAARVEPGGAAAAMATTPALGRFHELLPHQQGHPGAPAAAEIHGTGAALAGAAALPLAEYVRDRRARLTSDLVGEAFDRPFPDLAAPPVGDPAVWVAVLRTAARGSEGEAGMDALADLLAGETTPGTIARDVERWIRQRNIDADTSGLSPEVQGLVSALNTILGALPPSGPGQERNVASAARALDRRLQAARGIREAAHSLLAAIRRAEDLVYVETPALDSLPCGQGDEQIDVWGALRERLADPAHRALKLILCVPLQLGPFAPEPMGKVRDALLKTTLEALRSLPHFDQRVAILTPNAGTGRRLHLSSTTVIVDDAYLLTGSTHLWRRGLSFDSSLALGFFDESLEGGRPRAIGRLRRELIAARLGLAADLVPSNPADLLEALRLLPGRDGGRRLTTRSVLATTETTDATSIDVWNPDGSPGTAFNLATFLASLVTVAEHLSGSA